MITAEQNELMTRVGPGTPAGKLLRSYWQPVALVDELEGERPVRPVRLLGEDLVLFRDEQGHYGLLDRHCPHRRADLAYGRLRGRRAALRVPRLALRRERTAASTRRPSPTAAGCASRSGSAAYPVVERSGILWAYLGAGEPPAFPQFDCFVAPDAYTFAFKGYWDCNWLQALEVGIDPAHASFLHRLLRGRGSGGRSTAAVPRLRPRARTCR